MNKYRIFLVSLLVVTLLMTTGCVQSLMRMESPDTRGSLITNLPNMIADQPTYQPGEYFVYDNGFSKIATGRVDQMVVWKYGNGATSRGYDNFLIPQISWESNEKKGESTTDVSPDFLWPLFVGNSGDYIITQTLTDNEAGTLRNIRRQWKCRVDGTDNVSVPAGNYNTYVIACDRYGVRKNEWRGRHTYYYSSEIRHYVILEKEYLNGEPTREVLTEHGFNSEHLPKVDLDRLRGQFHRSLEEAENGIAETWVSSSGLINAMLIPYQSFQNQQGQICRDYRSIYNVQGRVHQHIRKACKTEDGLWQRFNR